MTTQAATARRARVATSAGFAAQGFVYATLLTSLEGFKERYGIDDGQITLVVLGVCVMAALGTVVADRVARSASGSRAVLGTGLVIVAAAVVVASVAPDFALLAAGFAVYGVGLGMVDAGTNMQAVAIQREYGRSLLTGFYASWSAGGIVGAVLVAATTGRTPTDPVAVALLAGTLVAGLAAVLVLRDAWRGVAPAVHADGVARPDEALALPAGGSRSAVPWGAVTLLGLGVVAYYVADTAISTWSTIYLGDVLLAAASFAPLGYAAYLTTTLGSRLVGDPSCTAGAARSSCASPRSSAPPAWCSSSWRPDRGPPCSGSPWPAPGSGSSRPCASPRPVPWRPGTPTRSSRGSTSSTTWARCSVACWWAPSAAPRR